MCSQAPLGSTRTSSPQPREPAPAHLWQRGEQPPLHHTPHAGHVRRHKRGLLLHHGRSRANGHDQQHVLGASTPA